MVNLERREIIKKALLGAGAVGVGLLAVNGVDAKQIMGRRSEAERFDRAGLKRRMFQLNTQIRKLRQQQREIVQKQNGG
jgi:hypothetical protein